MPPRKRAAAPPKREPTPETQTDPVEPEEPNLGDTPADGGQLPPQEPEQPPTKSDLQTVEQPCAACFPDGWPAVAYSVGCEHGTWVRDDLA